MSKPSAWRRLQLHADTRLDRLHELLVAAFGWAGYHMHCFSSDCEEFGVPDPEFGFSDERRVALGELLGAVGDGWQHEVVVEALLAPNSELHHPVPVAAKRACPPEDCGGPWGYAELKEILADPSHEQHREMLDWLGLDNAEEFDPAAVAAEPTEEELAGSSARR